MKTFNINCFFSLLSFPSSSSPSFSQLSYPAFSTLNTTNYESLHCLIQTLCLHLACSTFLGGVLIARCIEMSPRPRFKFAPESGEVIQLFINFSGALGKFVHSPRFLRYLSLSIAPSNRCGMTLFPDSWSKR